MSLDRTSTLKHIIYSTWPAAPDEALSAFGELQTLNADLNGPAAKLKPGCAQELAKAFFLDESGKYVSSICKLLPADAQLIIGILKSQIEANQYKDHPKAKRYAEKIIELGHLRRDQKTVALGTMKLGESTIFEGKLLGEAEEYLNRAAELYLKEGDLIGWGRTVIGKLLICLETNSAEQTLAQAQRAMAVFETFGTPDLCLRLLSNKQKTVNDLGRHQEATELYQQALSILEHSDIENVHTEGVIYNNGGNSYFRLGEFHKARACYEKARQLFEREQKIAALNVVTINVAYADQYLGQYQRALKNLHKVLASFDGEPSLPKVQTKLYMTACYTNLNRAETARDLALEIVADIEQMDNTYQVQLAETLYFLGTAEANLGETESALKRLAQSEDLYQSFQAAGWTYNMRLLRGTILLNEGKFEEARANGETCYRFFSSNNQQINLAHSALLLAEAHHRLCRPGEAKRYGKEALQIGRRLGVLDVQQQAHAVLGEIYIGSGELQKAKRHLQAAAFAIERQQKSLTITLQPHFMERKGGVLKTTMRLLLQEARYVEAFETLERGLSLNLQTYRSNRERLAWASGSADSRALLNELEELRERHHVYYRLTFDRAWLRENDPEMEMETAKAELELIEKRMHQITEQLYLNSSENSHFKRIEPPKLDIVQQALEPDTVLIEYYINGQEIWAFVIRQDHFEAVQLPIQLNQLDQWLEKYSFNIRCASQMGADSPVSRQLARVAQQLGAHFYNSLIRPLEAAIQDEDHLIIVPYGLLHYLPFNAFSNGDTYLVNQIELSTLPSAGWLLQASPKRLEGRVVLGYSANGRLPEVIQEVDQISCLLQAESAIEEAVTRDKLSGRPGQILHIAAHGQHRIDQPELSFLELADGQLFADDLLQQDLSYELVVLSACETGRSTVKEGDELIGLGRGVLCAGAGAMMASLWRVEDSYTAKLMAHFYTHLLAGKSKRAALKEAQTDLLAEKPDLHPAYWAPFQLIGNPGSLTGAG